MAAPPIFTADDTLDTMDDDFVYTDSLLKANKLTKGLACTTEFQLVGPPLTAALASDRTLRNAKIIAGAGADAADSDVDDLVFKVSHALLIVTNDDRTDPQYVSYMGTQTPTEIVRPILGAELDTVREWLEPLKNEPDAGLHAFHVPMQDAVAAGDVAEKSVAAADKDASDFRLVGERAKVTAAFNAARGNLFGALTKFQHDNGQLRLPTGWAASFFRHAVKGMRFGTTVAKTKAHLARLAAETVDANAHLVVLEAKEAAHAAAKLKRDEARALLAKQREENKAKKVLDKELKAAAVKKLPKK